jgi:hypothetical protein
MNVAFPALLVFLLILPGIIFRYSYARGSWGWTSPESFRTTSDELAYGVLFAVGLHAVWLIGVDALGYTADLQSVLALALGSFGKEDSGLLQRALDSFARYPGSVAGYFLSLAAGAWIAGNLLHRFVRRQNLDHRYRTFRFKNEWYYLLSGEVTQFRATDDERSRHESYEEVDGVYLSAVVQQGSAAILYRGIVEDWTFDRDGRLDWISLRLAHRRQLDRDLTAAPLDAGAAGAMSDETGAPDERYYEIRGDRLLLRYADMRTLNLDYFRILDDVEDNRTDVPSH